MRWPGIDLWALPLIAAVGASLRLWRLSGNYPILPDTALQVDSARALLDGELLYTYLDLPGPGIALLPLLRPAGFTFGAAQLGIALYGIALIVLVYALTRALIPEQRYAPLVAAALVAINPSLVAASRIGFFEPIQLAAILLFLFAVAAYLRSGSLYWLWGSFALSAALLLLKEPNAIVVAVVYGSVGIRALYSAARRRRVTRDLAHLVAGGVLVVLPSALLTFLMGQEGKVDRASNGFSTSFLSRNLDAAWDFFRSPIDSPATGYFIYDHAIAFEPRDLAPTGIAWALLLVGAFAVFTRVGFTRYVAVAALMAYGTFFLFFGEWFSRFSLSFLVVQLMLIAVGVEVAWGALADRWRPAALVIPLLVLPVAAAALVHDAQMIDGWDEEASYVDNGILVRPLDVETLKFELFQRPGAYVVTTQPALVRTLDPYRRDDVLDLWKFGVQRENSEDAVAALRAIVEERVSSGQEVLYVPSILDIEDGRGQQPRGWGQYYDLFATELHAELLHVSTNFVSQKFNRARPTFMIYRVPARSQQTFGQ